MFELIKTSAGARLGRLHLRDIVVDTPAFMPVGTLASVKAVSPEQLWQMGYRLLLANTYHLIQRPGADIIAAHGNLRSFMAWKGCVLTDSGGYQVFSLNDTCRISEDGVEFRSIYNGDTVKMTPASVIDSQRVFDSDIVMPLDVCAPFPSSRENVTEALEATTRWASVSARHWREHASASSGHLYGIVQGGCYSDLRRRSLDELRELEFSGYAIGGLAVGEPAPVRNDVLSELNPMMPVDRPRYLMGVGTPRDILDAVARGVDQFDCVIPTRHARNAHLYTRTGVIRLRNSRHKTDTGSVDSDCSCACCTSYSRAYLHHLYRNNEIFGAMLGTVHNLTYYAELMGRIRHAIADDSFDSFCRTFEY